MKKNYLSIFAVSTLLFLTWFSYSLFIKLNKEATAENLNLIPSNAALVLRLDAKTIVQESISDIFFNQENDELYQLIKDKLKHSSNEDKTELGVDYLSEVIAFVIPYHNGKILGISFNLSNKEQFEIFTKEKLSAEQTAIVKNNVGYIFHFQPNDPTLSVPKEEIKQYVSGLKYEKNEAISKKLSHEEIADIYTQSTLFDQSSLYKSSNAHIKLGKSEISLTGEIELKKAIDAHPTFVNHPKGLNISSAFFPNIINDSIAAYSAKHGVIFPKIKHLSINYQGAAFGDLANDFGIIPTLNTVIEFQKPFDFLSYLKSNASNLYSGISFKNNQLIYQNTAYFVKQLSPTSVYVGLDQEPKIVRNSPKIIEFSGDLNALFNLKNGDFIFTVLEMNPYFSPMRKFIEHTDRVSFVVQKSGAKKLKVNATFTLKNGFTTINEAATLFLQLNKVQAI